MMFSDREASHGDKSLERVEGSEILSARGRHSRKMSQMPVEEAKDNRKKKRGHVRSKTK